MWALINWNIFFKNVVVWIWQWILLSGKIRRFFLNMSYWHYFYKILLFRYFLVESKHLHSEIFKYGPL